MSRESFLARVRQAAEAGRAYRVHARDLPPETGYVGAGDDKLFRMHEEVIGVGGRSQIVDDLPAVGRALMEVVAKHAAKSALCWEHPLLERLGLDQLLAIAGVEKKSHSTLASLPSDERRRQMLAADIGVTSTTYAVAETGTLAVCSAPGSERLASLLPPVHVAIVSAEQVLPDLFDLFAALRARGLNDLPSNLTLITGPSKTGDIELKLTTGVHGPGEWHVILVRNA